MTPRERQGALARLSEWCEVARGAAAVADIPGAAGRFQGYWLLLNSLHDVSARELAAMARTIDGSVFFVFCDDHGPIGLQERHAARVAALKDQGARCWAGTEGFAS